MNAAAWRPWAGLGVVALNLPDSVDPAGCGPAVAAVIANAGRAGGHETVRVLSSNTLLGFGKAHANADRAVRELNKTLRSAAWSKMQEVVDAYPSATVLNAERVVFRVKGNDYRAIVAFDFQRRAAFIKFVGTHAEYDRIDALSVDLYSKRERR